MRVGYNWGPGRNYLKLVLREQAWATVLWDTSCGAGVDALVEQTVNLRASGDKGSLGAKVDHLIRHKSVSVPKARSAVKATVSDRVGWAWTVSAMSSRVAPISIASPHSAIV